MPQRTVSEAQSALEELADSLNPVTYRKLNEEVGAAVAEVNRRAGLYMDDTTSTAFNAAKESMAELCEVRDQLAALTADGEAGRLTSAQFNERYQQLQQQRRRLGRRAEKLGKDADLVERIETDPVAWADERLYGPFPQIRPHFSF